MKRFVLTLGCILLLSATFYTQNAIQKAVDALAADPALVTEGLGVCVMEVKSGKILAEHGLKRGLIPASSLKVVTTATALEVLGKDFRFKTELQYDGTIDAEGVLHGNLYLKGYGDPTLGSDHFALTKGMDEVLQECLEAVQKAGIKKVDGKIVGDASFFGTNVNGRTWLWEDMGNYYGAGAWGLNLHENRYFIHFQQAKKIDAIPKVVATEPKIPNLLLINEVRSAAKGSGDNAYVFGAPYQYTCFLRGTIPIGNDRFTIKGAIPDPPFFAAYALMKTLEQAGIKTAKQATSQFELNHRGAASNKKRQVIHTLESPSLDEIIVETNMKSVNLYCEAMLRYLGQKIKQDPSPEAGLAVIYDFWEKKGLQTEGFFMADGSGLSPFNTVSAFQLAQVMRIIALEKDWSMLFRESLPTAGRSGSMRGLLRGTAAEGKLQAKSGGMQRVRSYTGYAYDRNGSLLAFCMIANHFTGKSSQMRKKMAKLMRSFSK